MPKYESCLPLIPQCVHSIDRTLKMYIGGAQKRPDAPYARSVVSPSGAVVGQVGEGNRKDIREAVEAAHKAAPGYVVIILGGLFDCCHPKIVTSLL